MRVLGLDPGLRLTGYACIDANADADDLRIIEAGVFRLGRPPRRSPTNARAKGAIESLARHNAEAESEADPNVDSADDPSPTVVSVSSRLVELERDLKDAIERLQPRMVAVESLFAHYKHPATAIIMGHARGVLLLTIRKAGLELLEFKPNEVKKSLTGHGHAGKEQMQRAVQTRFGLASPPSPPDVADALAIALCAAVRRESGAASVLGAVKGSRPRSGGRPR